MRLKLSSLLQIIILVGISLCLLFYKLDKIPSGLYVDEAVTGYNAYSILLTGKDEYGKALPIAMRFFGSYSPPLYTYLSIISIKLFGLSVFATRFLSALSGAIMSIIFFVFISRLNLKSRLAPFLGTLLFIICPWTIFYARAGYEIFFGFMLFSLGALFLLTSLEKPRFIPLAFLILSLSTYGAHTEIYLVPLLLLITLFVFRKHFIKYKVHTRNGIFLLLLTQLPNFYYLTTQAFWNKASLAHKDILFNYLTYFSPHSLFYAGDPDLQRSVPELSVFYSWMVVPFLIGLYFLIKNIKSNKYKFIAVLLLLSPIPASLAVDSFSTQRALPLLLPMSVVIVVGLDKIIRKLNVVAFAIAFLFLVGASLVLLWRSYFVFFPNERAKYWSYGFQDLAQIVQENPNDNYIIDQTRIKPAHIELAFFMKLDPEIIQSASDPNVKNNYYSNTIFNSHYKFLNIETRAISWEKDIYTDLVLVGDKLTISETQVTEHALSKLFEIRDPVDEIVFVGYKTNPAEKCKNTDYQGILCKR